MQIQAQGIKGLAECKPKGHHFSEIILKPYLPFFLVQVIPLIIWLLISDDMFYTALGGYAKATMGYRSFFAYSFLLLSFFLGCHLSGYLKNDHQKSNITDYKYIIKQIHYASLGIALFSTFFVIVAVYKVFKLDFVSFFFSSQLNELNIFREDSPHAFMVPGYATSFIKGRHLILTSMVTWCILYYKFNEKLKTLPIIFLLSIIISFFTSSRIIILSLTIIFSLYYLYSRSDIGLIFRKLSLIMILFILLDMAHIFLRSYSGWEKQTGSGSIVAASFAETSAYLISPVNYSIALMEHDISFEPYSIINNFIPVIRETRSAVFGLFGVTYDISNNDFLEKIPDYYNGSLNQIGLLGQFFSALGFFLVIPTFLFGLLSGMLYSSFSAERIYGCMLYPFIYIVFIDSYRFFQLTGNIIVSNFIMIIFVILINKYYSHILRLIK